MIHKMERLTKTFLMLGFCIVLFTRCGQDDSSGPDPESPPDEVEIVPVDFLSESTYDQLSIEVVYVDGYEPTTDAVNGLKTFLEERLNKSGGITISMASIPSPGKAVYTLDDIKEVEESYRIMFPEGSKLAAWFFFADTDYADNEEDSKVLGITYSPTSVVIFEKSVREFSGDRGQPTEKVLETTVMEHEFGHVLGLVNNGTAMVELHQDIANGRHCNNTNCLMYYAAEHSGRIINFLSGGIIPELCNYCLEDLKNNGGK